MTGVNSGELLILAVLAVVLLGPARLPHYAAALARLVRRARTLADDARERLGDELGPEVTQLDWSALDLRRYDPRAIVRDALADDGAARTPRGDGDSPAADSREAVRRGRDRQPLGDDRPTSSPRRNQSTST